MKKLLLGLLALCAIIGILLAAFALFVPHSRWISGHLLYAIFLIGLVSLAGGAAIGYLAGNKLPVSVSAVQRVAYFVFGFACGSVGLMWLAVAWMEAGHTITFVWPM